MIRTVCRLQKNVGPRTFANHHSHIQMHTIMTQTISRNISLTSALNQYQFARKKSYIDSSQIEKNLQKKIELKQQKTDKDKQQKGYSKHIHIRTLVYGIFALGLMFRILMKINKQHQSQMEKKPKSFQAPMQITEFKAREMMVSGHVLNYQIEVKLNANKAMAGLTGQNDLNYSGYSVVEFRDPNGRLMRIHLEHSIVDFLYFTEGLTTHDYKVKFTIPYMLKQIDTVQEARTDMLFSITLYTALGLFLWKTKPWAALAKKFQMNTGNPGQQFFDSKKIVAIKPQTISTTFKDVAGMHEAKFQITEFVQFLKQPDSYIEMGAKIPKGALLTGPPGTGKTLIARACAGEAGVPFFYVSGSDFVEKYVGLGASRVRKLFDEAEKNSPSIIFIDQIDAIGKKRQSGPFANEERDNTLNQLLVRMDGFDSQNKVVVMGATNIKDSLDPALLRPGRFDRSVQIGLPNFQERKQILKVHLVKVKFDPSFSVEEVANKVSILTPGFSGAELANVCNEAAILAAREERDFIEIIKFQKATERVVAGLEKRNLFSEDEKVMLSYYECGKAVVGWFTEGADPVVKLSILPFSKASKGYSHSIRDEHGLYTQDEIMGKACCCFAGRAAESYFKEYITTNGDHDLQRGKHIITLLVKKYGMSEKLKHIAFPDNEFVRKPYSSKIENLIDEEIERISNICRQKAEALIVEKQDLIRKLQEKLIVKETLTHNEIKEILGERPFKEHSNYQKFIDEEQKESEKKVKQPAAVLPSQSDHK